MQLRVNLVGQEALKARLDALGKNAPRAAVRALNHTANVGRTQIVRNISGTTRLRPSRIRGKVTVERATFTKPEALINVSDRWVPLVHFGPTARRSRRAVTLPGMPHRTSGASVPPPFVATMKKSGHTGFFQRGPDTRSRSRAGWKTTSYPYRRSAPALPIRQLFGPSVADLVRENLAGFQLELNARLAKRLEHEIDFLIAQGTLLPAESA